MRCPKCGTQDDKVIDSRSSREGSVIRRRRECLGCQHRYTTYEEIEQDELVVIKRDGRREAFSKEKLKAGIARSCEKRPVSPEVIDDLVEKVADSIRNQFEREVPFRAIGEAVIIGLRDIDPVAYVRFASIYRRFDEAGDFLEAVKKLEVKNDTATLGLPGI